MITATRGGTLAMCIAVLACMAALVGCGSASAPTSPTSTLSVSGTWTGSFSYTTGGVTVTEDVTLTLLQPSLTASGTWSASSLATGTVSFPAAASVSGTFTISHPNIGSSACTGSSTISGSASASSLALNVANLTPTATCPWATGMKFTLHK